MSFLPPNQQRQSTEGTYDVKYNQINGSCNIYFIFISARTRTFCNEIKHIKINAAGSTYFILRLFYFISAGQNYLNKIK